MSWEQRQDEALPGSARRMHKLTRDQSEWALAVVESAPGNSTADPRKLLASEASICRARASGGPGSELF
eukprot:5724597-Pyramimonas_sp.AAC.1